MKTWPKIAADLSLLGARNVLDFLLPVRCVSCGVATDLPEGLCAVCWSKVSFLEQPFCERLGTPFGHEVGKEVWSPRAIAEPPLFNRHRSAARYDGPARDLVLALKFASRRELAKPMGRWMARSGREFLRPGSLIVPVPLHRTRLLQRRFNQAADLARIVSERTGGTFRPRLLVRTRRTRQQVGLKSEDRRKNVRAAFKVRDEFSVEVTGRDVVLVDDVFTTGSTVTACTRALLGAGASSVDVLTFALADPAGEDVT